MQVTSARPSAERLMRSQTAVPWRDGVAPMTVHTLPRPTESLTMRSQPSEMLQVIEVPPEFPEDTRVWEHPFLARVREALEQHLAGVILDLARTVSLGPHGTAALCELAKYAGFVGGVVLLRNVPDALAPALRAAGVDRVCFIRREAAPDEVRRADATASSVESGDNDPRASEREARRTSGGVLRLEGPDVGMAL